MIMPLLPLMSIVPVLFSATSIPNELPLSTTSNLLLLNPSVADAAVENTFPPAIVNVPLF